MSEETTTEQLAEIEGQGEPVQVREGRWRTCNGLVKDVTAMPTNHEDYAAAYPWWDGVSTWRNDGRWLAGGSTMDLVTYLGPIEPDKTQELPTKTQDLPETGEESSDQLIGRISLLRHRVTQLEELVTSLRTINEGAEKAVSGAGVVNDSLRLQLEAVKAELVQERLERNRWHNQVLRVTAELDEKTTQCEILQIELDAAQQVPADSPELRQLRADLAEVTQDRDTYRHAHELLVNDVNATHARTKAMTVEAIAEWLEPIRLVDSAYLANATMQHLPQIMRHLTGLDSHAID